MKNVRRIAALLTVCIGPVVLARPIQRDAGAPRDQLSPKIHAPNQRYKAIRDAKDWHNPRLIIRANGIEVMAEGIPSGSVTVEPADLLQTLVGLPVRAWPYGRIALAQHISIRDPNRSDNEAINRNHELAEKILKELSVQVDWWP